MAIHWGFKPGTKIRIIFKNGSQVITKFVKTTERQLLVTENGTFRRREVRSCNYYKPLPHEINK